MRLFKVPAGTRVRFHSLSVRLRVTDDDELPVVQNTTIEGTVTDEYLDFNDGKGLRRLVRDLAQNLWRGYGVWQSDTEVEEVGQNGHGDTNPSSGPTDLSSRSWVHNLPAGYEISESGEEE